mgnify:CR=1 FL=1
MIVQTKNGVMLHGEISKDPVLRDIGQKRVLKFDLKASRTQDETGKWQSFFVGVTIWHGIDQLDGMFEKGDQVTVFAQKLKTREYNGKTYYDVDADDIVPGGLVTFRWLQQMVDLMSPPARAWQTPRRTVLPRLLWAPRKQTPSLMTMPTTCRSDLASCAIWLYGHLHSTRKEVGPWASTHHAALWLFPAA